MRLRWRRSARRLRPTPSQLVLLSAAAGAAVGVGLFWRHPPVPPADPPATPPIPAATLDRRFEPCAHCHQIGEGAKHSAGPHLNALIGRRAGEVKGYPFSLELSASRLTWDEATLDAFVADPQSVVPGTRMSFPGIQDPAQRRVLIDFLKGASIPADEHETSMRKSAAVGVRHLAATHDIPLTAKVR